MLVNFCERIQAQRSSLLDGVSIEGLSKIRNFFKEAIQRWIQMINDAVQGDPLYIELQETKLALLWGIVSCYPYLVDVQSNQSLLMDLVDALDRLLVIDSGKAFSLGLDVSIHIYIYVCIVYLLYIRCYTICCLIVYIYYINFVIIRCYIVFVMMLHY